MLRLKEMIDWEYNIQYNDIGKLNKYITEGSVIMTAVFEVIVN